MHDMPVLQLIKNPCMYYQLYISICVMRMYYQKTRHIFSRAYKWVTIRWKL